MDELILDEPSTLHKHHQIAIIVRERPHADYSIDVLQGLAPHHDDVEIFVCQTEGSKRWRLYSFKKGFAKPSQSSGDLSQDSLGDPIMDVTLKVISLLHDLCSCSTNLILRAIPVFGSPLMGVNDACSGPASELQG